MARVKELLESGGYMAVGAMTDEEAIQIMNSSTVDALLVGGGVEASSRKSLIVAFEFAKPRHPVIEHFGGPNGLLDHVRTVVGLPS